jgi:hypothetical protein
VALSQDEAKWVPRLQRKLESTQGHDQLMDSYYDGAQRLLQLGLAVPPELRKFTTIVNWPALVVEAIEERCDVKSFLRGGQDRTDSELRDAWDGNNLDSEFPLTFIDMLVYGRGYLSVGSNEDDAENPIIAVESPTEMALEINPRNRRVLAAFKLYGVDDDHAVPYLGTLYLPDVTIWLEREGGGWVEIDRDVHNLGRVPVVPFLNRRRSGRWEGRSEIENAISLTDAAARTLTNLQLAGETHSVPHRYFLGASKSDFVDETGAPIPVWESYFSAIFASANKDAKVGQFAASDLSNFTSTVNHYAQLLAGLYGLPMRYLGQNTANPPSADGIRADEARLIKRAERKMSGAGDQLGRTMALWLRFKTGVWPESGDRIKVEWHDAATPTYAAKADAIQKLTGGKPILSREGGWDELGWSDARKERERDLLAMEDADPVLERVSRQLMAAGNSPAARAEVHSSTDPSSDPSIDPLSLDAASASGD